MEKAGFLEKSSNSDKRKEIVPFFIGFQTDSVTHQSYVKCSYIGFQTQNVWLKIGEFSYFKMWGHKAGFLLDTGLSVSLWHIGCKTQYIIKFLIYKLII